MKDTKAHLKHKINSTNLHTEPDMLALWSGLGAERAEKIAQRRTRLTLEKVLRDARYDPNAFNSDIEAVYGNKWSDQHRDAWKQMSEKLVSGAAGAVEVYLCESFRKKIDQWHKENISKSSGKHDCPPPVVLDELMAMDFEATVKGNYKIGSIRITEFNKKDEPVNTYLMPISRFDN